jgi:hypothetical protein
LRRIRSLSQVRAGISWVKPSVLQLKIANPLWYWMLGAIEIAFANRYCNCMDPSMCRVKSSRISLSFLPDLRSHRSPKPGYIAMNSGHHPSGRNDRQHSTLQKIPNPAAYQPPSKQPSTSSDAFWEIVFAFAVISIPLSILSAALLAIVFVFRIQTFLAVV